MAFTYEHSHRSAASPASVWRLYSDVSRWPAFDTGAERIDLDGPFAAGTSGSMKLHGQDPFPFTLTEVEAERLFTDETPVGDAVVRVRHLLAPVAGGVEITHAVQIDGPPDFAHELGAMITADMPETIARLARLAEEHDTP